MKKFLNYIFEKNNLEYILFFILGIILILFPNISLAVISYPIIVFNIYLGIDIITNYEKKHFLSGGLHIALVTLFLLFLNTSLQLTKYILGIYFLIYAVISLKDFYITKNSYINKFLYFFISILNLFCFIIFLFFKPGILITIFSGILLLMYSITNIFINSNKKKSTL